MKIKCMLDLKSETWDKVVLKSDKLTLVDFWAPWCIWCGRLMPVLKEMEGDYEGRIIFTAINTEKFPDIAAKYGVMSLPTIKFFCKGRDVTELIGYMSSNNLRQELDRILSRYKNCLSQSSSIR